MKQTFPEDLFFYTNSVTVSMIDGINKQSITIYYNFIGDFALQDIYNEKTDQMKTRKSDK